MASSSGCVAFERQGKQYAMYDNKVNDRALWVLGTPGVLAVYDELDYKQLVDDMVTTLQPIDFFKGQEEVADIFTNDELLALGVHGYLGKLMLDDGQRVVASTNYDNLPIELVVDAMRQPWQLSRDPTKVRLHRANRLSLPRA